MAKVYISWGSFRSRVHLACEQESQHGCNHDLLVFLYDPSRRSLHTSPYISTSNELTGQPHLKFVPKCPRIKSL